MSTALFAAGAVLGAIRLFLAIIVAAEHTRHFLLIPAGIDVPVGFMLGVNAGFAVMYFYVISGFLMSYVLRNNYAPTTADTLKFYQSRFIRIFSLYWPIMAITLIFLPGAAVSFFNSGPLNIFTGSVLFGVDWNMALGTYPVVNPAAAVPYLAQSWTLGAELTFYALAPFLLRSKIAMWSAFFISATIRGVAVYKFGFDPMWNYTFFPATILFFLLGGIAGDLSDKFSLMKRPIVGWALLVLVPIALMYPGYTGWDTFRFWLSFICFSAALPSIFAATKDSRILNAIGNLSYPLYLTHAMVIMWAGQLDLPKRAIAYFGQNQISGTVVLVIFLTIAIFASIVAHAVLENYSAKMLRFVFMNARTVGRTAKIRIATS